MVKPFRLTDNQVLEDAPWTMTERNSYIYADVILKVAEEIHERRFERGVARPEKTMRVPKQEPPSWFNKFWKETVK